MQNHVRSVHNGEKDSKIKTCPFINCNFKTVHLTSHIRRKHENKCGRSSNYKFCQIPNLNDKTEKYKCDICNRNFRLPCQFKLHYNTIHNRTTNYKCDVCNKDFPTAKLFTTHYKEVHGERKHKWQCQVCPSKYFSRAGELTQHVNTVHKGERKFSCYECNKSFGTNSTLNIHLRRVHENRRDHKCEICHKAFVMRKVLMTHISVMHDGTQVGKFKCDICEKSFKSTFYLENHIKSMHHNFGRYSKCHLCKKVIISSNLDAHMENVHTTENNKKCPICGKIIKLKVLLQRHVANCTKSKK